MHAIEHLEETKWSHPSDYAGFSPEGDFVIYSRNRDSELLDESNYELIFKELSLLDKKYQTDDTEPFVYDFRASHWACGWVEYLLVSKNAPEEIKQAAGEIICALSDYPVLSDDDYSERQYDAIYKYWDDLSLSERVELCRENDTNIFAARHDVIPEFVFDDLSQSEMFY